MVSRPSAAHHARQIGEGVHFEPCLGEALDIFVVGPALEVGMDEAVELAELKLERALDLALAIDAANAANDVLGVPKIALMIIGEIVNEQVLEIELGRTFSTPVSARRQAYSRLSSRSNTAAQFVRSKAAAITIIVSRPRSSEIGDDSALPDRTS